eukprot:7573440-Pyramimonas_sp.AAC.1
MQAAACSTAAETICWLSVPSSSCSSCTAPRRPRPLAKLPTSPVGCGQRSRCRPLRASPTGPTVNHPQRRRRHPRGHRQHRHGPSRPDPALRRLPAAVRHPGQTG